MCCRKMIKKISHIIKGWYYKLLGINLELVESRMSCCNECSDVICITKNTKVCKHCGCFLDAKTRIKEEECPLNKW